MGDEPSSLHEVDYLISGLQCGMLLPRSHPLRNFCLQGVALARLERYRLLEQQDDLEESILGFTESIFFPLPWEECSFSVFDIFFHLVLALSFRPHESRQPEDVKWCIRCLRYLLDRPLENEAFKISPEGVTEILAEELKLQTELEPGATMQDIEEMAVHCHELLSSNISKTSLIAHIMTLVSAVNACGRKGTEWRAHSDKVVACLRDANRRLPDLHEVSIALALCLFGRFETTFSNDDHEEGMAILDKIIAFPPQDRPINILGYAVHLVTSFAIAQCMLCGKPEDVEKEIYRFRTLLAGASPEDPVHSVIVDSLSTLRELRRIKFGGPADNYLIDSVPPFQDLIASLSQPSGGLKVSDDQLIDAFYLAIELTDMADIEQAIEYCRLVIASYHPNSQTVIFARLGLGVVLHKAFWLTQNIGYLDNSISVLRDLLNSVAIVRSFYCEAAGYLVFCLHDRFLWLHHKEDLDDAVRLFPLMVHHQSATIQQRFHSSCVWATVAHMHDHPSISIAYDLAMSLMQDSLTFTPTLEAQHFQLVSNRYLYEVLPLNYASYLVHTGRLYEAIETLEQGRALLWSEMRGLRTSIDQLRAADSCLADKFVAVNKDLGTLLLTIDRDGGDDDVERKDRMGLLLLKQRKLSDDRVKLVSQVRSLPGFESFLKAPSFDNLISAASRGPVIVINHSEWRSDIIILHHGSPPSLITTANDFYHRAIEFRDRLITCRIEHGLDSKRYERVLSSVLDGLHDLVGRPVIERLRSLNVPEQSRVWWCPTSVFCSLPLHAMGPIPSGDGIKRYFFDIYIPSYTPTLSALIESRKPSEQSFEKPSILLVAQPDQSLLSAFPEIWAINRLDAHVRTLMSSKATPSGVLKSLQNHRFLHFACHGKLEDGKPFEASFQLHNGKRLTLLDLIRSQLPSAEFAFLSACHTAEMTEGSIADEALHLTAAMQYCGFRSVVGTMWGMADDDGPELVERFYKSMFSSKQEGTPYYERSARALRDGVRRLRKEGRPLERWVNFVHYGA